jgi:signal transduction histidine kinase
LILTVHDNGIGLSPQIVSDPRSLGLLGMRERAQFWGGSIDFVGVAGQGTTMTLRVSVAQPKEAQ